LASRPGDADWKSCTMRIRSLIVAVLLLLLQGCGMPHSAQEFHQTAEAQYLQSLVDQLSAHNFQAIEGQMDARVQQADIRRALEQVASRLPPGSPLRAEPADWNVWHMGTTWGSTDERRARVAIEYAFPDNKWMLASATLSGEPGAFRTLSFKIEPLAVPLDESNAMTFKGKGMLHFLVPLMAAASFAISAFAFVRCIRARALKRKWLWAVFTLIGVFSVSLNWTSGDTSFQMLRFNLLGAGVTRSGWLGPWVVAFSVPLGALLFLTKYRKLTSVAEVPQSRARDKPL
jgi:hypothetical protein